MPKKVKPVIEPIVEAIIVPPEIIIPPEIDEEPKKKRKARTMVSY